MHKLILLPLLALAGLAIYKIVTVVVEKFQNRALARQWGCQPCPAYPNSGFFGLNNLKNFREADKARLFPDLIISRTNEMSAHMGREVSTFSNYLLGSTTYFTTDPKNIQAVLATKFADFDLGWLRNCLLGELLGAGIFTTDGKEWEHSRAMLRPNFIRDQISDLEMEERHVQNLISVMPIQDDGWTKFTDIQTLFFRLTIDASTEFLFGESIDSQLAEADSTTDSHAQNEKSFSVSFDRGQWHISQKSRLGEQNWLYRSDEYKTNIRIVNDFAKHYVDLALSKPIDEKKMEDGHGKKEKYVFLEALAQQTRDPEELRAQVLNVLLAGRDTTASLLSWTFHELLHHQDVFEKLRAVIIADFGTYSSPKESSFTTLKNCQYLQHTISESLRLWPVVPVNGRRANKATILPRGGGPDGLSPVFIPKDTQVDYSVHAMHRRKDLWGEDADDFKPERFVGRKPGWEFLPFNGGPRICIGQQFALTEASYVLVRLLQKFDKLEAAPGYLDQVVRSNLTLTNAPGNLVTLRLREAKE